MHGHAVDAGRVDHHRQRSGEGSGLEGLEILLAEDLRWEVGWGTVLAGPGSAIGEIVLRAGAHMVFVDVVGVIALIAFDLGLHHTGVDDGILAETLPDAGPAGVAAEVNHGVIHPRTVGGAALVSGDLSTDAGQFGVERSPEVDGLWEERTALNIRHAVVVVETIYVGNPDVLHRLFLDDLNPFLPLFEGGCPRAWCVQDGSHLVF